MSSDNVIVLLAQEKDYQFAVDFGADLPALLADEPAPLGQGAGPAPAQLLGAAIGNCLAASLLFALRKYKQQPEPITCSVEVEPGRNAEGRTRILQVRARLTLGKPAAALEHLDRVLAQFESFCTVTESVRQGIPVSVEVFDSTGAQLK
ncbi:MAG: OsmC family protein [Burkholderiales bacterium]